MSDDVIEEDEKLKVIKFNKLDYFNEINRFYDVLLRLYEDGIKGEKTVLSEQDINVLNNSSVYANVLAISALTSLSHLYEKLRTSVEQRNETDREVFAVEYNKVLENLEPTSRMILSKFYTEDSTTNSRISVNDIFTNLRNTFSHNKYDLGYVISGNNLQGLVSGFDDLTNTDAVFMQDLLLHGGVSNEKGERNELEKEIPGLFERLEASIPLNNFVLFMNNDHGNRFRGIVTVEELIILSMDLSRVLNEKNNISFDLEKSIIVNGNTNKSIKLNANTRELIDSFVNYYGVDKFNKLDEDTRNYILKNLLGVNSKSTAKVDKRGAKKNAVDTLEYKLEDDSVGDYYPITVDYIMGIYKFAKDINEGKISSLVNVKTRDDGSKEYEVSLEDYLSSMLETKRYIKHSDGTQDFPNNDNSDEKFKRAMALKELVYFQFFVEKGAYNGKIYEVIHGNSRYLNELAKEANKNVLNGLENTDNPDEKNKDTVKRYRNIFMHSRMKPNFLRFFRKMADSKSSKEIGELEVDCLDLNQDDVVHKDIFRKTYEKKTVLSRVKKLMDDIQDVIIRSNIIGSREYREEDSSIYVDKSIISNINHNEPRNGRLNRFINRQNGFNAQDFIRATMNHTVSLTDLNKERRRRQLEVEQGIDHTDEEEING